MKKRAVTFLLTFMTAASTLAGCGNAAAGSAEPGSTETVQSAEKETEEPEAEPEVTATLDEKATAEPKATAKPEATAEPEATAKPEATTEPEATAKPEATAEPEATAKPEATEAAATATPEAEPTATVYTYTDMNQTMWAKSSVNVRDLPSTDGNKVSSLKGGQEVTVTGRCNETGWYRLEGGSFVSGNYLVTEKPAEITTVTATGTTEVNANEWSAGSSRDFINYLNQKRAEQGLAALEWDSTLEANAIARAQQLASDFSHNGGTYAENIAEINSDPLSIEAWYNAWYNSEGHRANMFSTEYVKAACAYYTNGSKSYVITVFQGDTSPSSSEQLQQQVESGELELISSETLDNGQTIEVYGTPGAVISVDGDMSDEEIMEYLKEIGWID